MHAPTLGIAIRNILPSQLSGQPWYAFLHQVEALKKEGIGLSITPLRRLSLGHFQDILQFESVCEVIYPHAIAPQGSARSGEKHLAWIRRTLQQGPLAQATRRAEAMADMVPDVVHVGASHTEEPTVYSHAPEGVVQYLIGEEDPARRVALDSYHLGRLIDPELLVATLPLFVEKCAEHIASVHLHLRDASERVALMSGRHEYARKYLHAIRNGGDLPSPIVVELGSQNVAPGEALELLRQVRKVLVE